MMGDARGNYEDMATERELLYKILFDMRNDINELKRMMTQAMAGGERTNVSQPAPRHDIVGLLPEPKQVTSHRYEESETVEFIDDEPQRELSKEDMLRAQTLQALRNNNFRRKDAARELFISERTLYRRMKALGIDEE
jgi:DNA-binding NtrC family response regulator